MRASFFVPKNRGGAKMKTQKIRINWLTVLRNVSIIAVLGANILVTAQLNTLGGM